MSETKFTRLTVEGVEFIESFIEVQGKRLTTWELQFMETILKFKQISSKQRSTLSKIIESFE
jgi:hypothetical protein